MKQNENGDAAYLRALELAKTIIPNGPIGVKMAKHAINRGTEVSNEIMMLIALIFLQHYVKDCPKLVEQSLFK